MPAPTSRAPLHKARVSPAGLALATAGFWACLALSGAAQTAEPTSTTATYGSWTVRCATPAPPAAGTQAPVKICEMTTRLNLKGNDGQSRPLLQVALGQPPGAEGPRLVLQVPVDVALREPVTVSLDQVAAADVAQPAAQELLLSATYLSCSAGGCLAETGIDPEQIDRLKAAKTMNVGFASLNADKRIVVPVPLAGFVEAAAALGLAAR